MNNPIKNDPALVELVGDATALRKLLSNNMAKVMLEAMLNGTPPDEVEVTAPLELVMGIEGLLADLINLVSEYQLVDKDRVGAYMKAEIEKAQVRRAAEQAESEEQDKDDCPCPNCVTRRSLESGADINEDSAPDIGGMLQEFFAGLSARGANVQVREIKGDEAQSILSSLKAKADGSNDPIPPKGQMH